MACRNVTITKSVIQQRLEAGGVHELRDAGSAGPLVRIGKSGKVDFTVSDAQTP